MLKESVDLSDKREWGKPVYEPIKNEEAAQHPKKQALFRTLYSRYMLVMWPEAHEFEILAKHDPLDVLDRVATADKPCAAATLEWLVHKMGPTMKLCEKNVTKMLTIMHKSASITHLVEFLKAQKVALNKSNSKLFALLVQQFGYEKMKESLRLVVRPGPDRLALNCQFIKV